MRRVEHEYRRQDRWNRGQGAESLQRIEADPDSFRLTCASIDHRKQDMIRSLGDLRGKRVLDLGSGRGEISVVLAQRGAEVTGIEIGENLVELARRIAQVNEVQCRFLVGSVHELPLEDASFDYVVGGAILHHLPRQGVSAALAEAHRVLRPGGTAVFLECLENSRLFDALQNLIPVGKSGTPTHRPSSLNRRAWKQFLRTADDRTLTNAELEAAGSPYSSVHFRYYGFTGRLQRLIPGRWFAALSAFLDRGLCHRLSPIKKLSQSALITFHK